MKNINNQRGFTLIEMIIAAGATVIIIGSALSVYLTQHKHMIVQDQISEMQQNVRAGIEELTIITRMAGYNVPVGLEAITAYNTNPDTIEVNYDGGIIDGVSIDHEMPDVSSELRCIGDISSLSEGDWLYIYDPVAEIGEYFEATEIQLSPAHIQHNTMPLSHRYPAGSMVIVLENVKYFIDNTTDPDNPRLMVKKMGEAPQIYADNITDLQFQYVLSSGAVVDVPPTSDMVREVIINISGRTERRDPEFNNEYRTRDLQTKVKVRNIGIN